MGRAKALLPFGKARLIDHVAARIDPQVSGLLLNANDPAIMLPGVQSFPDTIGGFAGPLAGIHAGLVEARRAFPSASHVFMLPVDAPFFPRRIVEDLSSTLATPDDVALASSEGRMHPVMGLWPVSALPGLEAWLADPPTLKVRAFLEGRPLRVTSYSAIETPLGPLDPFFNINTPDDLDLARKMLEALEG